MSVLTSILRGYGTSQFVCDPSGSIVTRKRKHVLPLEKQSCSAQFLYQADHLLEVVKLGRRALQVEVDDALGRDVVIKMYVREAQP